MSSTLKIVVGQDMEAVSVAITDSNGDPVDLTGKTLAASIKHDGGSISVTISNEVLASGTFDMTMTETETASIPIGQLSKLKVTSTEGAISLTEFCVNVLGVECL